jgi:hypothetical protein
MKSTGKRRRAPSGRLKSDAHKGLAERALHSRLGNRRQNPCEEEDNVKTISHH